MSRVFLSYARENTEAAHQIAVALDASGHETWWDHQIHGGSHFSKEIIRALNDSDAIVVLWSPSSVESSWVLDEAAEGRDTGKLVPTLIEPCIPPLGFRQFHAIDLTNWRGDASARKALLDAILSLTVKRGSAERSQYRIDLVGGFRMTAPGGTPLPIRSRKSRALIAMLATAPGGERTRSWLQRRLWGSQSESEARRSLARELRTLSGTVPSETPLIDADAENVRIDLSCCNLSVPADETGRRASEAHNAFLAGLDIQEPGFMDWLEEQRSGSRAQPELAGMVRRKAPSPDANALDGGLPQRPTIAVASLPSFADAQAQLSLNRAEAELVDRLTRLRWLTVTESDLESARDAVPPSSEPSSYAVTLELTRVSGGICLTTRLMSAGLRRLLLLRRHELEDANSDHFADAMCELVAAIDNQVEIAEQQRVMRKPFEALTPQEIVWRARWHLERLTREDAMLAGQLVDRLVSEAPEWSEAVIQAGFVKAWSIWASRGSERQILELRNLAARAVAADKFDARGHLLIGMADTWLRQSARACSALEEAISLNPSLCAAYMQLGSALYLSGDPNAALDPMETALRLNARDTQAFCVRAEHGMVKLMLGDYERAATSAELALLRKPGYWFAHVIKINALWRSGDAQGARRAHADLLHAKPRFSLRYLDWVPFVDQHWPNALREGVEKAEQASFAST